MLRQYFISTLATITGMWITLGVLFFSSFIILAAVGASSTSEDIVDISSNSILHIKLEGEAVERFRTYNFIDEVQGTAVNIFPLNETIAAIKEAAVNSNFSGIFIEANGLSAAPASLAEIRQALEEFKKSGKWIVAYSDGYSQSDYYIASCADEIDVNPIGAIDLHGLSSTVLYFKDLMDNIGVEMQVFKVGTYKSAVEPFMLSEMSDANREQINTYLGTIWDYTVAGISEGRNIPADSVRSYATNLASLDDTKSYLRRCLANDAVYRHEAISSLKERVGISEDEDLNLVTPHQLYCSVDIPHTAQSDNKIAVLYAFGDIVDSGSEGIVGSKVVEQIEDLIENDKIGGLVFRVNSGGGSAFASEQIWEAIERFKKTERPVYVSMGDYAASGGYYISCGADRIFANPTTLTGSIGIFGMIPCFENVMKNKIGINPQSVTTNENANFSTLEKFTPLQARKMQAHVEQGYELFTTRCAEGRNMKVDDIKAIAEGRVWDGETALKLGLVDSLGSLSDAVVAMAEALDFGSDYQVIEYPKAKDSFWEIIEEMQENSTQSAMKETLGEYYDTYMQIKQIKEMNPLQCRMDKVIIK